MTYQTLPVHLIFQLSNLSAAVAVACSPRHDGEDTSPVLYADWICFGCLRDATRCSCSYSMSRYSRSHTTHRHSSSRCCSTGKPHGLWGTPPFRVQSYSINTNFENVGVSQVVFRNEKILFILLLFEKMFLSLHAEALKEWQTGIWVLSAAFGAFAFYTMSFTEYKKYEI